MPTAPGTDNPGMQTKAQLPLAVELDEQWRLDAQVSNQALATAYPWSRAQECAQPSVPSRIIAPVTSRPSFSPPCAAVDRALPAPGLILRRAIHQKRRPTLPPLSSQIPPITGFFPPRPNPRHVIRRVSALEI